jgi:hypothetical protein
MEDQAIYKDEYLQETVNMVQKILDERECHLVPVGQFIGNELTYKITIKKNERSESN